MSFLTIIPIAERQFRDYIASAYEGSYPVVQAYRSDTFTLPLILVKAGQLSELAPGTHIFEGKLSVSVITQVDDADVDTHEDAAGQVYQIMSDEATLMNSVNATGEHFRLFGYYLGSHDSERQNRALVSTWEYEIKCQLHNG